MLGIYHGRHAQVHNRGINGQSSQTPAIPFRHFKRILFTIWKRDQRENNLCKYARGLIIINFFSYFCVHVHNKDVRTGFSKGYGFVKMETEEAVKKVFSKEQHYLAPNYPVNA